MIIGAGMVQMADAGAIVSRENSEIAVLEVAAQPSVLACGTCSEWALFLEGGYQSWVSGVVLGLQELKSPADGAGAGGKMGEVAALPCSQCG